MEDYKYIDLAQESVNKRMIIWYYTNPSSKERVLFEVPLSRESAINYWTEQNNLKLTTSSNSKNMINKIKNKTDKRYIFLYDSYPDYKNILDVLLYAMSIICTEKNVKREVGSRYMQTVNQFIRFIKTEKFDIKRIDDFTIKFQKELSVYIASENKYFQQEYDRRNLLEILNFVLNQHNLDNLLNVDIFKVESKAKNQKSKSDISQEILIQLLAASVKDINEYMKKVQELESWRKIYNNKKFDSLENIANAFQNYPDYYNDYKNSPKMTAIFAYRKRFNIMAIENFNIDLYKLSSYELTKLVEKGHNINDFLDPFIMAWFFDDVLKKFPLNENNEQYVYTGTAMNKYTRYPIKTPVMQYIKPYGRSSLPSKAIFDDILSRKYPTASEIFPFLLYWIIQTGANTEAVFNIKNKETIDKVEYEVGDYFIEGDIAIVKSYKNRGTGDWYYFSLDKKEKNGLYDYLKFLKHILKPLWNYQKNDTFWVYTSSKNISHAKIINEFNRTTTKQALKTFLKKHNILDEYGKPLTNIMLNQLRNSFVTMMDLKEHTIEEIQELIRHDKFDTRFQYYNNSEDLQHRNFIVINAIQESIIETAKNFQGSIHHNAMQINQIKKYEEVYLSKCSNINNPQYSGSKILKADEICTDWDNCLQCKNSKIFVEHLPKICYRLKQYEKMKGMMTIFEWENNFKLKHEVANDALKKWIETGGSQVDIDNAWQLVEDNKILLPSIFPTGSTYLRKKI